MTDLTPVGPYATKALEYLLAILYLALFVPFWRFVMKGSEAPETEEAPAWFRVPHDVHLHPGHTWLRRAPGATVTLGLDDFGHRLLGPLQAVELPGVGSSVTRDGTAFTVTVEGKSFPLRSPVDGRVVAVNQAALQRPDALLDDPYRSGWMVRVAPRRLGANVRSLLSGRAVRTFLDDVTSSLSFSRELGALAQDGGTPMHGFAREIDPDGWDALVRRHLLVDAPLAADSPAGSPRAAGIVIALALALLGTGWAAQAAPPELPRLPRAIFLPQGDGSPGAVLFRHESHVDATRPDCLSCHTGLFPILPRATKAADASRRRVTHAAMEAGKACGACHDGESASGLDDCAVCHTDETAATKGK